MKTLRTSKNNKIILRSFVFSLLVFGVILSFITETYASSIQEEPVHRIALSIQDSDTDWISSETLDEFKSIGIDLLEISFPNQFNASDLQSFYILLDSEIQYVTQDEIQTRWRSIANSVIATFNATPDALKSNIAAVNIFRYPADYRSGFFNSPHSDSLLSNLSTTLEKPLFYQSAFSSVNSNSSDQLEFSASRIIVSEEPLPSNLSSILYFQPNDHSDAASLQALESILNKTLNHPESLIIIPAQWFVTQVESNPSFSILIQSYIQGESVQFPMPEEDEQLPDVNWAVLFLFIIWASFILHLKYQPMYKAALPRYFLYHSFFVHDVIQFRIRNSTPGIIILIQHTFITGFFFYLLADGFITDTGLEVLSQHFPALLIQGFEKLSIFSWGVFLSAIFHLISVMWLYLPNKGLKQFSQIINLYSWPFHMNLIIVTAAVYIVEVLESESWALPIVIFYLFFWFCSFIIAALDGARSLQKFHIPYLFITIGLYMIFVISLFSISLWLPSIYQPLEMAFLLP